MGVVAILIYIKPVVRVTLWGQQKLALRQVTPYRFILFHSTHEYTVTP